LAEHFVNTVSYPKAVPAMKIQEQVVYEVVPGKPGKKVGVTGKESTQGCDLGQAIMSA
jgi:hypothetical protein